MRGGEAGGKQGRQYWLLKGRKKPPEYLGDLQGKRKSIKPIAKTIIMRNLYLRTDSWYNQYAAHMWFCFRHRIFKRMFAPIRLDTA
ncbi:MAG: hypothetical protein IJ157_11135 [Clostridia bacterium]|nr:hypothetical protein [Clostridia bacterium]